MTKMQGWCRDDQQIQRCLTLMETKAFQVKPDGQIPGWVVCLVCMKVEVAPLGTKMESASSYVFAAENRRPLAISVRFSPAWKKRLHSSVELSPAHNEPHRNQDLSFFERSASFFAYLSCPAIIVLGGFSVSDATILTETWNHEFIGFGCRHGRWRHLLDSS